MATRFYLHPTEAPDISPTVNATWDSSASGFVRRLSSMRKSTTTPMGNSTTVSHAEATDATDKDIVLGQFITPELAAQTIAAQTIKFQISASETSLSNNLFVALSIRAVSRDGSTVTGDVLALTRDATELATTLTNRQFSATTSALAINAGDRLVFEVGVGGTPAATFDHDSSISLMEWHPSDIPENDTETRAYNPWFEFANNLTLETLEVAVVNEYLFVSDNKHVINPYDTNNVIDVNGGSGGAESSQEQAQSFVALGNSIRAVSFKLWKWNSPTDNTVLKITSSLGGATIGSVTIASSGISAGAVQTFTFASPLSVTAGNTYYIELSRDGARDTTNRIAIYYWVPSGVLTYATYRNGGVATKTNNAWGAVSTTTDTVAVVYYNDVPTIETTLTTGPSDTITLTEDNTLFPEIHFLNVFEIVTLSEHIAVNTLEIDVFDSVAISEEISIFFLYNIDVYDEIFLEEDINTGTFNVDVYIDVYDEIFLEEDINTGTFNVDVYDDIFVVYEDYFDMPDSGVVLDYNNTYNLYTWDWVYSDDSTLDVGDRRGDWWRYVSSDAYISYLGDSSETKIAQSFVSKSSQIKSVELLLGGHTTGGGEWYVEIRDSLTGTLFGTSNVMLEENIPDIGLPGFDNLRDANVWDPSYRPRTVFTFSNPVQITAGNEYYLILVQNGTSSHIHTYIYSDWKPDETESPAIYTEGSVFFYDQSVDTWYTDVDWWGNMLDLDFKINFGTSATLSTSIADNIVFDTVSFSESVNTAFASDVSVFDVTSLSETTNAENTQLGGISIFDSPSILENLSTSGQLGETIIHDSILEAESVSMLNNLGDLNIIDTITLDDSFTDPEEILSVFALDSLSIVDNTSYSSIRYSADSGMAVQGTVKSVRGNS